MRIGFQGERGSNSDTAAHEMAETLGYTNVEYIPLVTSARVAAELMSGNIDYGVLAVWNSIGGCVRETYEALQDVSARRICTITLDIHHNLYKLRSTPITNITCIASHIQALKQTEETRRRLYPKLAAQEIEDTAIGAKYLADGELDANIAVLCPEVAGKLYGLELIASNLEDRPSRTDFIIVELA